MSPMSTLCNHSGTRFIGIIAAIETVSLQFGWCVTCGTYAAVRKKKALSHNKTDPYFPIQELEHFPRLLNRGAEQAQ